MSSQQFRVPGRHSPLSHASGSSSCGEEEGESKDSHAYELLSQLALGMDPIRASTSPPPLRAGDQENDEENVPVLASRTPLTMGQPVLSHTQKHASLKKEALRLVKERRASTVVGSNWQIFVNILCPEEMPFDEARVTFDSETSYAYIDVRCDIYEVCTSEFQCYQFLTWLIQHELEELAGWETYTLFMRALAHCPNPISRRNLEEMIREARNRLIEARVRQVLGFDRPAHLILDPKHLTASQEQQAPVAFQEEQLLDDALFTEAEQREEEDLAQVRAFFGAMEQEEAEDVPAADPASIEPVAAEVSDPSDLVVIDKVKGEMHTPYWSKEIDKLDTLLVASVNVEKPLSSSYPQVNPVTPLPIEEPSPLLNLQQMEHTASSSYPPVPHTPQTGQMSPSFGAQRQIPSSFIPVTGAQAPLSWPQTNEQAPLGTQTTGMRPMFAYREQMRQNSGAHAPLNPQTGAQAPLAQPSGEHRLASTRSILGIEDMPRKGKSTSAFLSKLIKPK